MRYVQERMLALEYEQERRAVIPELISTDLPAGRDITQLGMFGAPRIAGCDKRGRVIAQVPLNLVHLCCDFPETPKQLWKRASSRFCLVSKTKDSSGPQRGFTLQAECPAARFTSMRSASQSLEGTLEHLPRLCK